jgi:hypothetical protein
MMQQRPPKDGAPKGRAYHDEPVQGVVSARLRLAVAELHHQSGRDPYRCDFSTAHTKDAIGSPDLVGPFALRACNKSKRAACRF